MRSAIIGPVQSLVAAFNNLTTDQQAIFLDLVDPIDEKPKAKRQRKAGTGPKRRGLGSSPLVQGAVAGSSPKQGTGGQEASTATDKGDAGSAHAASGD